MSLVCVQYHTINKMFFVAFFLQCRIVLLNLRITVFTLYKKLSIVQSKSCELLWHNVAFFVQKNADKPQPNNLGTLLSYLFMLHAGKLLCNYTSSQRVQCTFTNLLSMRP